MHAGTFLQNKRILSNDQEDDQSYSRKPQIIVLIPKVKLRIYVQIPAPINTSLPVLWVEMALIQFIMGLGRDTTGVCSKLFNSGKRA